MAKFPFTSVMLMRSLVAQLMIVVVCVCGDILLTTSDRSRRAISDSVTHGLVAVLSWLAITGISLERNKLLTALLCGVLASAIDVDHFLAAHSFKLQNALHLESRPFLHNTLMILMLCAIVWILVRMSNIFMNISMFDELPWICLVAWISHHTRDAHRRGFWFGILGSTPPLPQWLYIGLILTVVWIVMFVIGRGAKPTDGVIYLSGSQDSDHHIVEL